MTQPDTSRALEVFLENRDEACPSCGYNLRGLKSAECPECEVPVRLEITRKRPVLWHAVGTFATGIVFGSTIAMLVRDYYLSGPWSFYVNGHHRETVIVSWPWSSWPDLVAGAGSLLTIAIWVASWQRLRQRRTVARWVATTIVTLVSLGWLQLAWWPFPFFGP